MARHELQEELVAPCREMTNPQYCHQLHATEDSATSSLDDIRTYPVEYDAMISVKKGWHEACPIKYTWDLPRSTVGGPASALRQRKKNVGEGARSSDTGLRDKCVSSSDRVVHELRVLCEALHPARCHDQPHLVGLVSVSIDPPHIRLGCDHDKSHALTVGGGARLYWRGVSGRWCCRTLVCLRHVLRGTPQDTKTSALRVGGDTTSAILRRSPHDAFRHEAEARSERPWL